MPYTRRWNMGLLICASIVLCIFFVRDVFALGAKQDRPFTKLTIYSLLLGIYILVTWRSVFSLPAGRAPALLQSPWIWGSTLLIHFVLWRTAVWIRNSRSSRPNATWLITVIPAPLLLLSTLVAGRWLLGLFDVIDMRASGWIVAGIWIAGVWVAVLGFRAVYRGWDDWDCVSDVAQVASWTGIGILPFTGLLEAAEIILRYD